MILLLGSWGLFFSAWLWLTSLLASANHSACQKRGELPKITVAGRERNLALAPRWWSNVKPMF